MDFGSRASLTDIDLMLFHTMERTLFNRLTRIHGRDPARTKRVVAVWVWFESIGYHDFVRHLYAYSDDIVLEFARETELCLKALYDPTFVITSENNELPFMASQCHEPINLKFFTFHKDVVIRGVEHVMETICNIVLDEARQREAEEVSARAVDTLQPRLKALAELNRSSSYSASPLPVVPRPPQPLMLDNRPPRILAPPLYLPAPSSSSSRSNLNPLARPWSPAMLGQSSEDNRSMFITFSKGHPISREDISDFFSARYGPCVEAVMIEKAGVNLPPMYGRVVFTSASMIAIVLNGQRTAKFMIKGKHLWARMYVPRHGSN